MHDETYHLLQLLHLMMPVYVANMAPPFVKFWRGWNVPISERYLGAHKTVLGFVAGIFGAVACAGVLAYTGWSGSLLRGSNWLPPALAAGIGAMTGDSVKSFVKRRKGVTPGASWKPWDQWDFVIGGLSLLSPWLQLSIEDLIWIFGFTYFAAIGVNHIAYFLKIRDTKL